MSRNLINQESNDSTTILCSTILMRVMTVFASRAAAEPYDGVIKGRVVVEGTFCVFAHFWRLNAYESV